MVLVFRILRFGKNHNLPTFDFEAIVGYKRGSLGINAVFHTVDFFFEGFQRIFFVNFYRVLHYDRAIIHFFVHKMDGETGSA